MHSFAAIVFLVSLTAALAVMLALANSKLKVFEDPRVERVTEMLPGNNCGACGMPGCRAFAEKVVEGALQPSRCTPGGAVTAQRVADYLGIEAGEAEKRVARLLCAGGANVAIQLAVYRGHESCRSAAVSGGGGKGCRYGCLGFGDCRDVCTFDAIRMSPEGLPVVDFEKCTACGDCVRVCPKGLFEIAAASRHLFVQCKSELKDEGVLAVCRVGCTACGKCVADAPQGLLTMKRNLPVMNLELLHMQSPEITARCPTGAITWIEDQQFEGSELFAPVKQLS